MRPKPMPGRLPPAKGCRPRLSDQAPVDLGCRTSSPQVHAACARRGHRCTKLLIGPDAWPPQSCCRAAVSCTRAASKATSLALNGPSQTPEVEEAAGPCDAWDGRGVSPATLGTLPPPASGRLGPATLGHGRGGSPARKSSRRATSPGLSELEESAPASAPAAWARRVVCAISHMTIIHMTICAISVET